MIHAMTLAALANTLAVEQAADCITSHRATFSESQNRTQSRKQQAQTAPCRSASSRRETRQRETVRRCSPVMWATLSMPGTTFALPAVGKRRDRHAPVV